MTTKQAFLSDSSSAGNWVPARFLAGYMTHVPAIEPEAFDVCPILLTQPAQDRWTPLALRCVCVSFFLALVVWLMQANKRSKPAPPNIQQSTASSSSSAFERLR